jgi:hypothetical protein
VLLDQSGEKKKVLVSGNNQLLKGAIFAVVSMAWFCFLFAFVNMEWEKFSPFAPFSDFKQKEDYIFYFICFSFFITTLIYSTVFYRNNLQPTDLLLRFGIILVTFTILFILHYFFRTVFASQKEIALKALSFLPQGNILLTIANAALTFLFLYMVFYPIILFFSSIFFNGFFGLTGFILCFFITGIFHLALYALADLEHKLMFTRYPVGDLVMIIFFTLLSFGIGAVSGEEEKRKRTFMRSPTDRLRGNKF